MKRRIILSLVLVIVFSVMLSGCRGYIGSEKAIDVALDDLGIDRVGAARTDATLNEEGDSTSYTVVIDMNDHIEQYIVDAKTGDIVSHETIQK